MTFYPDLPYVDGRPSAVGDLFLPEALSGTPVLLIHGGGWKALAKEDFAFMVPFFLRAGRPVFNINYRLLGEAFWPACGEDCRAAAEFILSGGLESEGLQAPEKIIICGASAGGHLAMATGLGLPHLRVAAILSMAGPSRIDWVANNQDPLGMYDGFLEGFFGTAIAPEAALVRKASPALMVPPNPPRLFCLHSRNDRLVPPEQSAEACRAWSEAGGQAEVSLIDGDGDLHGFWIANERERLRPEVGEWVDRCLSLIP